MITAGNVPIAKYVPYCPPMAMPPPADMPTYRQPSPPTMKRKRDDDDDEAIITRPAPPTGNLGASALSRLPPRTKQQALCDHHGWFNPKVYQDEYQYQLVCQLRLSEAFTREGKKCHGYVLTYIFHRACANNSISDRQMQYGIQCGKCAIIMCRICNRLANPVHSQRKLNTGVKNANRNRKRQRRS